MQKLNNYNHDLQKEEMTHPSDNFVIVIGRQFGSGGRTVGKIIAERLGIEYYDTEILKRAAQSQGIEPHVFEPHDEKRPSVLKTLLQGVYGIADNFHTVPLGSENIYRIEAEIIKDLASKNSCVIVGRSADHILHNKKNLLSVFLHAPIEKRVARILERKDATDLEKAMDMARRHDKRREDYYNFFTGERRWGVASNYHLSLDTSGMDNDSVAEIIIALAKKRFKDMAEMRSVAPQNGEESPGNTGHHAF